MRRTLALSLACACIALLAGCSGVDGTSRGATVTVYVSAPLHGSQGAAGRAMCAGARQVLERSGGKAGDFRVRAVCLNDTGGAGRWTAAAVGANARRATEDSTTVGYLGELDPVATRFSQTIVNAAGIAQISGPSGGAAMSKLLRAIENAGSSGSLRQSVHDALR